MRTYIIGVDNYSDAIKTLKKLRKRGARIMQVMIVVEVDDHRKIQKLPAASMSFSGIVVISNSH